MSAAKAMEGAMVWMNSVLRSRLPAMEFLWEGKRKGKLDPLVYNYLFK